jgi:hypothetical protein
MSTFNKRLDRADGSYPVTGQANRMLEVVMYKWILHYKRMWEASKSLLIYVITKWKSVENFERFLRASC